MTEAWQKIWERVLPKQQALTVRPLCWADNIEYSGGCCGQWAATDVGLCAPCYVEIFGREAPPLESELVTGHRGSI